MRFRSFFIPTNLLNYYKDSKDKLLKAIEESSANYENYLGESEANRESSRNNEESNDGFLSSNIIREAKNENKAKSHINDTPQNNGNFSNEDFASQIEFAEGNESNEENQASSNVDIRNIKGNTNENSKDSNTNLYNKNLYHIASSERDTLMERLADIDRNYRNLMKDWLNEFSPLCWEESTYE